MSADVETRDLPWALDVASYGVWQGFACVLLWRIASRHGGPFGSAMAPIFVLVACTAVVWCVANAAPIRPRPLAWLFKAAVRCALLAVWVHAAYGPPSPTAMDPVKNRDKTPSEHQWE